MKWTTEKRLEMIYHLANKYKRHPVGESYEMLMERIRILAGSSDEFLNTNIINYEDILKGGGTCS